MRLVHVIPVLFLATACSEATDLRADAPQFPAVERIALYDGTADGVGVLDFLNDPSTTMGVLDHDVALDRRAAQALANHRNGPDTILGTADDNLFDDIDEVDGVYWVGNSALSRILNYAKTHGWVPTGSDVLGTWDGVTFTVDEATAVIDIANEATYDELDHEVPLNRRAADSIVAERPVVSVQELAGLYYVGNSALNSLLTYSEAHTASSVSTSPAEDDVAIDFTELFLRTTLVDNAYAQAISLQAELPSGWLDEVAHTQDLTTQLWDATFSIAWDDTDLPAEYKVVGPYTVGGDAWLAQLDQTLVAVDEMTADGHWHGELDPTAADLYADRQSIADALSADLLSEPGAFVEVELSMDLAECFEEAVALIDTRDGKVTILHLPQNC